MKLRLAIGFATLLCSNLMAQDDFVDGRLIQFNDNGAWSWFEDERAIVDQESGQVLVSSVSDSSGALGRTGDCDVASFFVLDGRVDRFTLNGGLVADDHNSAALLKLDNGHYLAAYSNHNTDSLTRTRVSQNAEDISSWFPELIRNNGAGTTYNNLFQLSTEPGRVYNFTRTVGFDPNVLISEDNGQSWSYGGRLMDGPGRPYLKYASDDVDTIHFINTEQHPRDFNNSVFHGYIRGGQVFDSFGNVIDTLDNSGMNPTAGTRLFQGNSDNVAWVSDLHLDENGLPFIGFSVQVGSAGLPTGQGGDDLRYRYARFDGSQWNSFEVAFAGSRLYAGEDDYTGNLALNPNNPNEMFISTNADPVTGVDLISNADGQRHYEIFYGTTVDGGETWNWIPITMNSTVDNLRPIVPAWDNGLSLIWMRGAYTSFTNYDLAIVGLVEPDAEVSSLVEYFDADQFNTVRADGQAWTPTSGVGAGSTDDRWHLRSGFGNGGFVITSDETGDEDVPELVTSIVNLNEDGVFDVYAYFWSNKNEDWEISAGIEGRPIRNFRKQSAQHVDSLAFENPIVSESGSGNEILYQVYLGRSFLAQDASLEIHVDDRSTSQTIGERVWYDGVGLALTNGEAPDPPAEVTPVTYIDADIVNTTLPDGTVLIEGVHYNASSTANDGRWNLRAFANSGTIFSSNDTGGEDCPRLKTTIESLVPGDDYEIFVYFWGASGATWRGRCDLMDLVELPGFNTNQFNGSQFSAMTFVTLNCPGSPSNPGPISVSSGGNPAFETGGYYMGPVMVEEDNRCIFEVQLGEATADTNGEISVFIDDLADNGPGNRTWYDGVGFRLKTSVLKGDVNSDGVLDLLDVSPFVDAISSGDFVPEADVNCDGIVNLLDVGPFVDLLSG